MDDSAEDPSSLSESFLSSSSSSYDVGRAFFFSSVRMRSSFGKIEIVWELVELDCLS